MYDWIKDKEFLSKMRRECSDVVNRLVQSINNDDYLKVEMQMVGSGAKNLETQNANKPVDLDYNISIIDINGNINAYTANCSNGFKNVQNTPKIEFLYLQKNSALSVQLLPHCRRQLLL